MDKKNDGTKASSDYLPDISGVFHIDDSNIPSAVLMPANETDSNKRKDNPGILISREDELREKKEEKKKKANEARAEKKAKKKKKLKRNAILFLSAAVVLTIIVLSIVNAVSNSKKPGVTVAKAELENISQVYETKGAALTTADLGELDTLVAFIENDYDVLGLKKDQSATITFADGTEIEGRVSQIEKVDSGASILSKLSSLLLNGELPDTSNYTVYIIPASDEGLTDGTEVDVKITVKSAENVLTVPSTAIRRTENGQTYVWMFKKSSKELIRTLVSTGIVSSEKTEITAGLKKNEYVVDSFDADAELYDGVKVKLN